VTTFGRAGRAGPAEDLAESSRQIESSDEVPLFAVATRSLRFWSATFLATLHQGA
jgi:hypothetical protein